MLFGSVGSFIFSVHMLMKVEGISINHGADLEITPTAVFLDLLPC